MIKRWWTPHADWAKSAFIDVDFGVPEGSITVKTVSRHEPDGTITILEQKVIESEPRPLWENVKYDPIVPDNEIHLVHQDGRIDVIDIEGKTDD